MALELEPFNYVALNNRGHIYFIQDEYEKALIDFSQSEKYDPISPVPHFFQGLIYEQQSELDLAIEKYTEAIELAEKKQYQFKDIYLARSKAWEKLGEIEKSEKDLELAEQLTIRLYPKINSRIN